VAFWSLEALEKAPVNLPVNLGSGQGVSVKELVSTLIEISNKKIPVFFSSDLPSGDLSRVLDMSRAREILGFNQLNSLELGLKKTFDWITENPNWQSQKYT
jgi:nucleoside-diphosphate-sugar epimerase